MTAHQLHAALTARGVTLAADGPELVVRGDVPLELKPPLVVLATGVRAIVTGRAWWASWSRPPKVEVIPTAALIPAGVTLLSVDGDGSAGVPWDRLRPDVRLDHPELFEGTAAVKKPKAEPEDVTATDATAA